MSSFFKLQTCIQINKNINVKNKHFIIIIQNKNRKHIKIKNKKDKRSLHHICFHGGLFNEFLSQKINKIKIKIVVLHLCVCPSWFKETGGLHNVRRSRVPTSNTICTTFLKFTCHKYLEYLILIIPSYHNTSNISIINNPIHFWCVFSRWFEIPILNNFKMST